MATSREGIIGVVAYSPTPAEQETGPDAQFSRQVGDLPPWFEATPDGFQFVLFAEFVAFGFHRLDSLGRLTLF